MHIGINIKMRQQVIMIEITTIAKEYL
jgi:hypothetical protein